MTFWKYLSARDWIQVDSAYGEVKSIGSRAFIWFGRRYRGDYSALLSPLVHKHLHATSGSHSLRGS